MFKKLYMSLFLVFFSALTPTRVRADYDESDFHFMTKPQLIQIIKDQHNSKDAAVLWATLKGLVFGSAATYAAFWFFKVNPQTAHRTFLKAINPF